MLTYIENCCRHPCWTDCVLDLLEDKKKFKLEVLMTLRFRIIRNIFSSTNSVFNAYLCPNLMIFWCFISRKAKEQGMDKSMKKKPKMLRRTKTPSWGSLNTVDGFPNRYGPPLKWQYPLLRIFKICG